MIKNWLPLVADCVTIAVGVVVLGIFGARYFDFPPSPENVEAVDVRLDATTVGVEWSAAAKTLIMALDSECVFCQESMSFYRRVAASATTDVQVVVAAPPDDTGIHERLEAESLEPDALVIVERGVLPVSGTPTLLLVDNEGLVTHAWIGRLDADGEADVLNVLFYS